MDGAKQMGEPETQWRQFHRALDADAKAEGRAAVAARRWICGGADLRTMFGYLEAFIGPAGARLQDERRKRGRQWNRDARRIVAAEQSLRKIGHSSGVDLAALTEQQTRAPRAFNARRTGANFNYWALAALAEYGKRATGSVTWAMDMEPLLRAALAAHNRRNDFEVMEAHRKGLERFRRANPNAIRLLSDPSLNPSAPIISDAKAAEN